MYRLDKLFSIAESAVRGGETFTKETLILVDVPSTMG